MVCSSAVCSPVESPTRALLIKYAFYIVQKSSKNEKVCMSAAIHFKTKLLFSLVYVIFYFNVPLVFAACKDYEHPSLEMLFLKFSL